MMSKKYQNFLVMLLRQPLSRKECKMFSSTKAFYTMTGFFSRNDILTSEPDNSHRSKRYFLTDKGEKLATLLATFDNMPRAKLREWTKLHG